VKVRLAVALLAAALAAAVPGIAFAHGGITGTQDVVQDYGVLIFLLGVVLVGAGVVAWVLRSPDPDEEGGDDAEA
jgi:hypothetical protein